MNRQTTIAMVCLLMLMPPTFVWAQTGRITGQVVANDTGEGLPGAHVEVMDSNLQKKTGVITDQAGHYTIDKLSVGTYIVKATFIGYKAHQVKNVRVLDGQSATTDFRLVLNPYEMEQIVISVSRRAENIVDAPASISKIDAQDVQKQSAGSSVASLLRNTKGIAYTQVNVFEERINARGFSTSLYERVLLLVDGRFPFGVGGMVAGTVPKDDIQDVEVIVGPESALYGPDAVAGVVSIRTKDPRKMPGTTLALAGGNRDLFRGRFRHAGAKDRWGWKLSGEYQKATDYETVQTFYNADSSLAVTDNPNFNTRSHRGEVGLFYYPTSDSRLSLSTGFNRADMVQFLNTGRIQRKGMLRDYQQVQYRSPNWHFNLYRVASDNGDSFGLHSRARNIVAGFSPQEAEQRALVSFKTVSWVGEGRYNTTLSPLNTHLSTGIDYRRMALPLSLIHEKIDPKVQVGFHGRLESVLGPHFRAVLATRVDLPDGYDTQISPKAALIFKPRSGMAFRATFNQAYLSPNLNQQFLIFPVSSVTNARGNRGFQFGRVDGAPLPAEYQDGIEPIQPEKLTTFELGFKSILSNRAYLDITAYTSQYKNFISPLRPIGDSENGIFTLDENGNPRDGERTLTYLNFGKQHASGIDVGLDVYATQQVLLKGNFSFVDAGELKDAAGITQPFNTPQFVFNIGLSASDVLMRGTFLDLNLRYVDEFDYREGVHIGTVPAYTLVDINLGYRSQHGITYKLSTQNVFDNKHIEVPDGARLSRILVGELQYDF